MNITEEILDRARTIVLKQNGLRVDLENELGLKGNSAKEVYITVKAEEMIRNNPGLLDQVRLMIEQGESKFAIARTLNCSLQMTDHLAKLAKVLINDEEIHIEDDAVRISKKELREKNELEQRALLNKVGLLLDSGLGVREIVTKLGITKSQANILVEQVRADDFATKRMMSKADKIEVVDSFLEEGKGPLQIAKALDISPGMAQKLVKKVSGKSNLADEAVKVALAKGTTLKNLTNKFGITDPAEVTALMNELFPDHIHFSKILEEENDIAYTIIPDSTSHFDWLNSNNQTKRFRYSVSPQNNYMFVQFDESVTAAKIYNLTDVHIGHKAFDRDRFIDSVEAIRQDPNAFAVLGGDIFEWAHKLSVGDPAEQILTPNEQVSEAARLLMPIKHKLLAYRSGNHDKGRGKHTSTDLAEVLAHYLHVPYFKVETVIHFKLQDQLFTVILDHGHSGGSIQAILKDAEKYKETSAFLVHAHFSGHVHNSQIITSIAKTCEVGRGLEFKRTYTIIGGSFLGYTGTYAEEAKYTPKCQDLTFFECHADGRYDAGKVIGLAK